MSLTALLAVSTGDWAWIGISVALYLLVAVPVLSLLWTYVRRRGPGGIERAAVDVERFVALRDEARKHLWRRRAEEAR